MRMDTGLAGLITLAVIAVTQAISYAFWGDMEGGYDTSIIVASALIPALTCFPICFLFLRQKRHLSATVAQLEQAHSLLRERSARDPMTGLLHRQALLEQQSRLGRNGAFVMIDIDHFKSINDNFGHAAGDAALILVANAIAGAVRGGDLVARFGGEEFCVFLPAATGGLSVLIAERIRLAIAAIEFSPAGTRQPLTASLGISMQHAGMTADQALEAADAGLYEAKRAGRNRIASVETHKSGGPAKVA